MLETNKRLVQLNSEVSNILLHYPNPLKIRDLIEERSFSIIRFQHGTFDRISGAFERSELPTPINIAREHAHHNNELPAPILEFLYETFFSVDKSSLLVGISDRSYWIDRCFKYVNTSIPGFEGENGCPTPRRKYQSDLSIKSAEIFYNAAASNCFAAHLLKTWAFSGQLKSAIIDPFKKSSLYIIVVSQREVDRNLVQSIGLEENNTRIVVCHDRLAANEFEDLQQSVSLLLKNNHKLYDRIFVMMQGGIATQLLTLSLYKNYQYQNCYYFDMGLSLSVFTYGLDELGRGNSQNKDESEIRAVDLYEEELERICIRPESKI